MVRRLVAVDVSGCDTPPPGFARSAVRSPKKRGRAHGQALSTLSCSGGHIFSVAGSCLDECPRFPGWDRDVNHRGTGGTSSASPIETTNSMVPPLLIARRSRSYERPNVGR